MKKVGLAVCYDTKNFGSQLQVLATVKKVEDLGCEAEIIRYKKKLTPQFVRQTLPRLFNISFVASKLRSKVQAKKMAKYPAYVKLIKVRNTRFSQFVKTHFDCLSPVYAGWETLVKETRKNYDMFLCGSDQLWLPNNLGSHFYTLEFAPDDKKKVSYATSFGVSCIPSFQKKRTARYLQRFDALSTRELAGAKIIRELTGIAAKVVCDPTMLLTPEDWAEVICEKKLIEKPYVFCYFLGSNTEHRLAAERLKQELGLELVSCPFLDSFAECDLTFADEKLFDVDAADFVNLIRNAEYVLTDSFHGTVFSILHQKKFLTFNRFGNEANSRNSRIDSLCELLKLQERRYDGSVEKLFDEIDYEMVGQELAALREASICYLRDALELVKES